MEIGLRFCLSQRVSALEILYYDTAEFSFQLETVDGYFTNDRSVYSRVRNKRTGGNNVQVGYFLQNNKRTGLNKCTGGNFYST